MNKHTVNTCVVRAGFTGFFTLMWFIFKANRNNKSLRVKSKVEFILPIPWI